MEGRKGNQSLLWSFAMVLGLLALVSTGVVASKSNHQQHRMRHEQANVEESPTFPFLGGVSAGGFGTHGLAFHPNGEWFYAVTNFQGIAQFGFNSSGLPVPMDPEYVPLPNTGYLISITPDGLTLLAVGEQTILSFNIDQTEGTLKMVMELHDRSVGYGEFPPRIGVSPDSNYFYCGNTYPAVTQGLITANSYIVFEATTEIGNINRFTSLRGSLFFVSPDPEGAYLYGYLSTYYDYADYFVIFDRNSTTGFQSANPIQIITRISDSYFNPIIATQISPSGNFVYMLTAQLALFILGKGSDGSWSILPNGNYTSSERQIAIPDTTPLIISSSGTILLTTYQEEGAYITGIQAWILDPTTGLVTGNFTTQLPGYGLTAPTDMVFSLDESMFFVGLSNGAAGADIFVFSFTESGFEMTEFEEKKEE